MKLPQFDRWFSGSKTPSHRRHHEQGSAVIVVLVLAMIMAELVADNGLVLHQLKQELKLIEKQQARKYQPPARPQSAPGREQSR